MLRRLTFILALFLASCSQLNPFDSKDGPPRWGEFPVPIYLSSELAQNAKAVEDFQAAINFWEVRSGKRLFDYKGSWRGNTPPVEGEESDPEEIVGNVIYYADQWKWGAEVAGKTIALNHDSEIQGAMILLHRGLRYCHGLCGNNTGQAVSFRRLLAHELGHFLGLDHSSAEDNIMYSNLRADGNIRQATHDSAALNSVLEPFD